VTLVADLPGCTTTVPEGVFVAGDGSICGLFRSFSFCSKAARVAAWAGVSPAWTEIKLAPKATHKPTKVVVFMK
jgi:hypothetical protein